MTGLAAVVAAVVAAGACVPVQRLMLRLRAIDEPNARSCHRTPTVRGGGLAVAAGALAGVLASGVAERAVVIVLFSAVLFGLVGLADDLARLPAKPRLILQFVVAGPAMVMTYAGADAVSLAVSLLMFVGSTYWCVGYVNAFNFMDGINGISAVTAGVSGASLAVLGIVDDERSVAVLGLVIAGASLGFLPFNFPRARLFLGDVGSYFIGSWLAVTAVVAVGAGLPVEAVVAPFGLYLSDTSLTLVRRVRRGEVWYLPHREHAYQQLIAGGWSHAAVTSLVGAATVVCALLGFCALGPAPLRITADLTLVAVVVAYYEAPRLLLRPRAAARALS